MTKGEALELESECDKLFSDALKEDCRVSRALIGYLSVSFGGNFINISHRDLYTPAYVKYIGDYETLVDNITTIQDTIQKNREKIELLMRSYNEPLED